MSSPKVPIPDWIELKVLEQEMPLDWLKDQQEGELADCRRDFRICRPTSTNKED